MKTKRLFTFLSGIIIIILYFNYTTIKKVIYGREIGEPIDNLNGVYVYYNGSINNVQDRNVKNGYNIGLKFQCVEFVKRYYFEHLNHKMPDSYGHAISFFNPNLKDNNINKQRNLVQFSNPSISKPKKDDIVVFNSTNSNPYGHVAIISNVEENQIEITQQNPGPNNPTRLHIRLSLNMDKKWYINNERILGWLRKK